jgi:hypothetical protein
MTSMVGFLAGNYPGVHMSNADMLLTWIGDVVRVGPNEVRQL